MMYCAHCGSEIPAAESLAEHEQATEDVAETVASADVEIERIRADKEIKIARISAGVVETDQAAELAHAEGVAEGMAEAIAPEVPDQAPETPVVVVNDNPEPEAPEIAPEPPTAESAPSEAKHERSGYGSNTWFA